MNALLIAALAAVLATAVWFFLRRARHAKKTKGKAANLEALDTLSAWQPQATRVMTSAERRVYNSLRAALPDHIVLAQVPLARFLKVPTRYSYAEWLRRVGLMTADLVVCDTSSQVVAIVDIRAPQSQETPRAQARHARMDRVIQAAGIPVHVWREDALPTALAARSAILGKPQDPVGTPAMNTTPATDRHRPLLDEIDVPQNDDVVEMGEPPPSTWFDDLESAHTPLQTSARGANAVTSGQR